MNLKKHKFSFLAFLTDVLVLGFLFIGIYFANTNLPFLENILLIEDGPIENATVLFLLFSSILTIFRVLRNVSNQSVPWLSLQILMATFFLFIAGEEMSWGQRIWNVETNDFFKEYNLQGETNLHNMDIGGVRVNTVIFGKLITAVLVIYLCITPILYRKKEGFRNLVNKWGIPIGGFHHGIVFLIFSVGLSAIPTGSKWELYEVVVSILILSILCRPINREIYISKKTHLAQRGFSYQER